MTTPAPRAWTLAWLAIAAAGCGGGGPSVGLPAPDFNVQDLDGRPLRLSEQKGKVVLLNFWATWCGPCRREIPDFVRLYGRYREQGLLIVGLSMDHAGVEVVERYRAQSQMNYPVAMAPEDLVSAYGPIQGIPRSFLVDRKGKIVRDYTGMRAGDVFETDIQKYL